MESSKRSSECFFGKLSEIDEKISYKTATWHLKTVNAAVCKVGGGFMER